MIGRALQFLNSSFCNLTILESWLKSTWEMSKIALRYLILDMFLYSVFQLNCKHFGTTPMGFLPVITKCVWDGRLHLSIFLRGDEMQAFVLKVVHLAQKPRDNFPLCVLGILSSKASYPITTVIFVKLTLSIIY